MSDTNQYDKYKAPPKVEAFKVYRTESGRIECGCVARLSSGGPAMTVLEVANDKANCAWHVENGSLETVWLPLVALVKP